MFLFKLLESRRIPLVQLVISGNGLDFISFLNGKSNITNLQINELIPKATQINHCSIVRPSRCVLRAYDPNWTMIT